MKSKSTIHSGDPLFRNSCPLPRQECASLVLRFHEAGWIHGSLYPRNIHFQPDPNVPRSIAFRERMSRFRLIDFGRSFPKEQTGGRKQKSIWKRARRYEEAELKSLFPNIFNGPSAS